MFSKKCVFEVNDKVFAKVRGYPAWPARVESILDDKATRYSVFFYGTYQTATVRRDQLWPYDAETKDKFGKKKMKGLSEALGEMENAPDSRTRGQLDGLLAMESESDGGALVEGDVPADVEQSAAATADQSAVPKDSAPKGRKRKVATADSATAKAKGLKRNTPTSQTGPNKQQKTSAAATPLSQDEASPQVTVTERELPQAEQNGAGVVVNSLLLPLEDGTPISMYKLKTFKMQGGSFCHLHQCQLCRFIDLRDFELNDEGDEHDTDDTSGDDADAAADADDADDADLTRGPKLKPDDTSILCCSDCGCYGMAGELYDRQTLSCSAECNQRSKQEGADRKSCSKQLAWGSK